MENIMVTDLTCLKIADFGTGTDVQRSRTMAVGTPVVNPDDTRPVQAKTPASNRIPGLSRECSIP